jgi:hypothetical protein
MTTKILRDADEKPNWCSHSILMDMPDREEVAWLLDVWPPRRGSCFDAWIAGTVELGLLTGASNVLRVAEQVPAVCDVLDAIERRNWERLQRLLHPDIHWTTAVEEHLHGPREVVERLSGDPPPAPPSYHEVRDGLMYRWIDCPG